MKPNKHSSSALNPKPEALNPKPYTLTRHGFIEGFGGFGEAQKRRGPP